MGRTAVLILALAFLPGIVHSEEPVRCAFGVCLGDPFKPAEGDKVEPGEEYGGFNNTLNHWTPGRWTLRPPTAESAFKEYSVRTFPSDPRIVEIYAWSVKFNSQSECVQEANRLQSQLTARHGDAVVWRDDTLLKPGAPESGRYIRLGCPGRNIYVGYIDAELKAQIEAEHRIKCAFGLCLGDVYSLKLPPWQDIADRPITGGWEITPPTPNPLFSEYKVDIVPSSRRIAEISAASGFRTETMADCERRFREVLETLQSKYGQYSREEVSARSKDSRDATFYQRSGRISLSCYCIFRECSLHVSYTDVLLSGAASGERQHTKGERRDAEEKAKKKGL